MSVIAVHFGNSTSPLFGLYHPPVGSPGRIGAALLCNPFGEEEIRAHRIFRVLAEHLARSGVAVLRFDYFGSGDSAGDTLDATLARWTEDVLCAHDELKDMSGASRIIWIGLRLGASLAARAAATSPSGLAGIVLWDPVINGAGYLAELARGHTLLVERDPQTAEALPPMTAHGFREAMGFEIPPTLEVEITALDLTRLSGRPGRKALLISNEDVAPAELIGHLEGLGTKTEWQAQADSGSWNSDQALNAFVVPATTIGAITDAVAGWR